MTFAKKTLKHLGRTAVAMCAAMILPHAAEAACSSPAGQEGDLRYDTTTKNFYFCNGTAWSFFSGTAPSDYRVPTSIKLTNTARTGDFTNDPVAAGWTNGYEAIQMFIEAKDCPGHKVCTIRDIQRWLAAGNELPDPGGSGAYAWVNSDGGADSGLGGHNTCLGNAIAWNNAASSSHARAFYSRHDVAPKQFFEYWRSCNISQRVWCCKFD